MQVTFPFQERYTQPEKASCPKLPLETSLDIYHESTTQLKTVWDRSLLLRRVLICFRRRQIRQDHFMRPQKAKHTSECPSLLYIWSSARRFQSRYKKYNIYGIIPTVYTLNGNTRCSFSISISYGLLLSCLVVQQMC